MQAQTTERGVEQVSNSFDSISCTATGEYATAKERLSDKQKLKSIKQWEYDMTGHQEKCLERYLELSGLNRSSLKKVLTPCIDDHHLPPEDF